MKRKMNGVSGLGALSVVAFLLVPIVATACQDQAGGRSQANGTMPAAGAPAAGTGENDVLAVIDGVEVTLADLSESIGEQLDQMDFEYLSGRHRLIDSAMRRVVRDRLVEHEAADRGITADALIDEVLAGKIDVSDEEVQFFYVQNQAQMGGRSFEQLRPQIRQFLESQMRDSALEEFAEELAAERDVEYVLDPFRVDIDIAGAPVTGRDDAVVTLVEFSDFECPYCKVFTPTLERIKDDYGDDVRVVFLQFPLRSIHPNAQAAAEASLCADEQGKFWEAHDLFFAEQESLEISDLKEKAGRLGLDIASFDSCFESGKYRDRVDAEMSRGISVGVSGTPAIFVNGRPLPGGAAPYEMIAEIIDDEIARSRR